MKFAVVGFSWLTLSLVTLGWMTHWLVVVRKARKMAVAQKTPPPSLLSYWSADPYSASLSVIGVVVGYFIVPTVATRWPELATIIGATADDPMNPLAAYLGGIAAPWLGDWGFNRLAKMLDSAE
jgi:hypothetical protein